MKVTNEDFEAIKVLCAGEMSVADLRDAAPEVYARPLWRLDRLEALGWVRCVGTRWARTESGREAARGKA